MSARSICSSSTSKPGTSCSALTRLCVTARSIGISFATLSVTAISKIPLRIAQISDVHFGGGLSLPAETMDDIVERVRAIDPDIVVVAGDLTTDGYEWEYEQAAEWYARITYPKIVIPGNHDSRNVGYVHFRRLFGDPYSRYDATFEP